MDTCWCLPHWRSQAVCYLLQSKAYLGFAPRKDNSASVALILCRCSILCLAPHHCGMTHYSSKLKGSSKQWALLGFTHKVLSFSPFYPCSVFSPISLLTTCPHALLRRGGWSRVLDCERLFAFVPAHFTVLSKPSSGGWWWLMQKNGFFGSGVLPIH